MKRPALDDEMGSVRDEFLSKSSRLYLAFYATLAVCTLFTGTAQLLVYEEKAYPDIASRLDLVAMILTTLSTITLQILAISNLKSIAASMNRLGRLLNVYLSPFIGAKERVEIVAKVLELLTEIETFWVALPRFSDGRGLSEVISTAEHARVESFMSKDRPSSSSAASPSSYPPVML